MGESVEPELALVGGSPIQHQIADQIRSFIVQGALQAGEELPTVRALAVGLAVNPRAVERAYRRLERGGYLLKEGQGGPRVTLPQARHSELERRCRHFLRRAASLGYPSEEVRRVLQTLLQEES